MNSPDSDLQAAIENTWKASTASVWVRRDLDFGIRPKVRRRTVSGSVVRAALQIFRKGWGLARTEHSFVSPWIAEGWIDLSRSRYVISYGSWGELFGAGHLYEGEAGSPADGLTLVPPEIRSERLWSALMLLSQIADGGADVRTLEFARQGWQLFAAKQSLPGDSELEMRIWVAGDFVCRLSYQPSRYETTTVELRDFGADLTGVDWTRLPLLK